MKTNNVVAIRILLASNYFPSSLIGVTIIKLSIPIINKIFGFIFIVTSN